MVESPASTAPVVVVSRGFVGERIDRTVQAGRAVDCARIVSH